MKFAVIVISLALGGLVARAEDFALRDRAFTFLEKNIMGRTQMLVTDGTLSADGENYQVHFEATIKWAGLEKTEEGLVFEETRNVKQTNRKLDPAGNPIGAVIKTDRVVVHRYALAERATAKALVGLATVTKNSLEDPTGKGFVVMLDLSVDNKELYLTASMAGFVEASLDGKTMVPVATASEATLFVDVTGKLQTLETLKFYKVDLNKDFSREELSRFSLSASEVR